MVYLLKQGRKTFECPTNKPDFEIENIYKIGITLKFITENKHTK